MSESLSPRPTFSTARFCVSGLLLLVAVCFLLLLNGQQFTNSLVAAAICVFSALLWAPLAVKNRQVALWVVLIHVLIVAVIVSRLPESYRLQERLNNRATSRRAHQ